MTSLTTPDNIVRWTTSDPGSMVAMSEAMGDSVQSALLTRQGQFFRWANAAGRTGQTGMLVNATGYQVDTDTIYRYDLTGAWRVWQKPIVTGTAATINLTLGSGGTATSTWGVASGIATGFVEVVYGSSPTNSASSRVSYPITPLASLVSATGNIPIGTGLYYDASATAQLKLDTGMFTDGIWGLRSVAASNTNYLDVIVLPSTGPTIAAVNDRVRLNFSYPVA